MRTIIAAFVLLVAAPLLSGCGGGGRALLMGVGGFGQGYSGRASLNCTTISFGSYQNMSCN